jgi:hypothetical protein
MSIIPPASTIINNGLDAAAKDNVAYMKDKAEYMNKFCLDIIEEIQCKVRMYPTNKSMWSVTRLKTVNDLIKILYTSAAMGINANMDDDMRMLEHMMTYYDESILVKTLQDAGYIVTTYIEKAVTSRCCFVRYVLFPQLEKYKISVA